MRRCFALTLSAMAAIACAPSHVSAEPANTALPTACGNGNCGGKQWVTLGSASASVQNNQMNVVVQGQTAVLNWSSFNIGADAAVNFQQDNATAVAINKIVTENPTEIFGQLTANGQIYLINPNRIVFGKTAKVDVGGLVASTLELTDEALKDGIAGAIHNLGPDGKPVPAFVATYDSSGHVVNGDIEIQQGASLKSADGGRILVFAPNVVNRGDINTPNGQTILAAGSKIYLAAAQADGNREDSDVAGLVVEVDVSEINNDELTKFLHGETTQLLLGSVNNYGSINADVGNISLVGLAVNQSGRVTAKTSVRRNGTILLRAGDGIAAGNVGANGGNLSNYSPRGGLVTLGAGSVTEIIPDSADTSATADVVEQPKSRIDLRGHSVHLLGDAHVTATSGDVTITAQQDPSQTLATQADNDSRVFIDDGAVIDVSGAAVSLSADRATVTVQLQSEQLKDSPEQRDSVVKGEYVTVDIRQTGVNADGSTWVGTPLADITGAIQAVNRTVDERSVEGGTITIRSQGDVIVSAGATLDISGGRKDYEAGVIHTTKLVSDGKLYDIGAADPNRHYDGIAGQYTQSSAKWGQSKTWSMLGEVGTYSAAFTQGADAGQLNIDTSRMILDGKVRADVVKGDYQNDSQSRPGNVSEDVWSELPSSMAAQGTFVFGNTAQDTEPVHRYRGDDVVIEEQQLLSQLKDSGFDPTRDALPETLDHITIRPSLFSSDGVGSASIRSSETVTVAAGANVQMNAGSSLQLIGSTVTIDGNVSATGGNVSALAVKTGTNSLNEGHDVTLSHGASIDVSGSWVNDDPLIAGSTRDQRWINGGSVQLEAKLGNIVMESDSSIDASGSAWLKSDGKIKAGSGGKIDIVTESDGTSVTLDGELSAYGMSRGGSLSITTANSICISTGVCDGLAKESVLTLVPDFFQQGGFGSYSLTSKFGGLVVAAGTELSPRQQNLVLDSGYRSSASGADLRTFSHLEERPAESRRATDLTLKSKSELRIESGAVIEADAGSKVSLSSTDRIYVDGTVQTHGGSIALTVSDYAGGDDVVANQAIWLGQNARLDVSGTTLLQPSPIGLRAGTVYDGGTVSLTANAGYVIAESGSLINVPGTQATLDLPDGNGGYTAVDVGSNAGTVRIKSAEGAVLEGSMEGHAGSATALGGTLAVTIDANNRGEPGEFTLTADKNHFSHDDRVIEVIDDVAQSALSGTTYETFGAAFSAPDAGHAGVSTVRTTMLDQGGFDALELTAKNLRTIPDQSNDNQVDLRAYGIVRVESDLNLDRRLVIDAPTLDVAADSVVLGAAYVAIGSREGLLTESAPTTTSDHSLTVNAQWLDVVGHSSIINTNDIALHAESDLRLRPVPSTNLEDNALAMTGSLTVAGHLELQADVVYPATFTDLTITAKDTAAPGSITVLPGDETHGVLSAGGALHLVANQIDQRGVLKAPLGVIDLQAHGTEAVPGNLVLAEGSVTSTSAEGQVIPAGQSEGGFDWVYNINSQTKLLFGGEFDPVPQQSIQLGGDNVALNDGAKLDASGGGDLQLYEWVNGLGGSRDILDPAVSPLSFAVLPTFGETIAPWDEHESGAFTSKSVGTTVYLEGVAGLPSGEYAVLPPRYALMPGAYLITELPNLRDRPAGQTGMLINGTPITTGYFGVAGTEQREDRTRGFSVVSSELLRDANDPHRPAEYTLTLASEFLAQQAADGAVVGRMPNDAGVVSIAAEDSLNLQAQLIGNAANGGRGAGVDIASANLVVTADGAGAADGGIPISADVLNGLGAESIFLGGRRSEGAEGTELNVISNNVTIASGANLVAPELILAARDTVVLADGATVSGAGESNQEGSNYVVNGDAAIMRVSGGAQSELVRHAASGNAGSIDVASGATVAADGSALFDVSKNLSFAGNIDVQGASLAVGAAQINLGDVPANTEGFNLASSTLIGINADELRLNGRQSINVFSAPIIEAQRLVLDTPLLEARAGSSDAVTQVHADEVILRNSTGSAVSSNPSAQTHGSLQISAGNADAAGEIEQGQGTVTVAGFDAVKLTSTGAIYGRDTGTLNTGAADVTLDAGVISGHRGSETTITTQGRVDIAASNTASSALADDAIGATLSINADTIHDDGRIVMASGAVNLHATGAYGVTLDPNGVIDVSGVVRDFTVTTRPSPGGNVEIVADSGNITLNAGSSISVAGAVTADGLGADAGSLTLRAPQGTVKVESDLDGSAQSDQRQGRATIDARRIDNLAALNLALNNAAFNDERVLRIREGDVDLDTDITAHRIDITVDGGALTVGNQNANVTLDASGNEGGHVRLAARDDVQVSSGVTIDASGSEGDGGNVELMSSEGVVQTEQGSTIDVSHGSEGDAQDGEVHARVNESVLLPLASGGTSAMELKGTVIGSPVIVEGVHVTSLDSVGGVIGDAEIANARGSADAFMANATPIEAALEKYGTDVELRPGVELVSSTDLTLNTPWDLIDWRYGGAPGVLTLRAAGDVNINQTLSDGMMFDWIAYASLPAAGPSWSYRIAAGADLASASPFGLAASSERTRTGSIAIAPGYVGTSIYDPTVQTAVRTGTGDVEMAAAGNVELGNAASVIYTAGTPVSGISASMRESLDYIWGFTAAFPENGGDIIVRAGGDMTGASSHHLVTEWLWRMGSDAATTGEMPTAWGIQFDQFTDGIGALGGGNVTLVAARDIDNVSAAIPTVGVPLGATPADNELHVTGGGILRVEAGRDIYGGMYFVGAGQGMLAAGGDIARAAGDSNGASYLKIALGDAEVGVSARGSIDVGSVFNPTIIPQSQSAGAYGFDPTIDFLTYQPDSRADFTAIAGAVHYHDSADATVNDARDGLYGVNDYTVQAELLRMLPPTLTMQALGGDIVVGGTGADNGSGKILKLAPAVSGQLELLAEGDVRLYDGILLSDTNPENLPTPEAPGRFFPASSDSLLTQLFAEYSPQFRSLDAPLHANDAGDPVFVVAQHGDLDMTTWTKQSFKSGLWLAKSAEIVAGRDILDPDIAIQHANVGDVSQIVAGRDIRYETERDSKTRRIVPKGIASQKSIVVDGPGEVLVSAGRDVDLGASSAGILTRGDVVNPALADNGANLTVLAGIGTGADYATFIDTYINGRDDYHDALIAYMQSRGALVYTYTDAVAQFDVLSRSEQMPFLERILFTEMRIAGRDAATSGSGDYSRGYTAISALFPDPDAQGRLALYFSRVYTLDGGDINLMVPGGEVNVGLAALPTSFGITKKPEELGIVTQSTGSVNILARDDVLVNTSRVFAGDGGSILIWSSEGDIDAGRGAKTAISAPPPEITVDPATGQAKIVYKAALNGSGIRAFVTTEGRAAGDVDLFAPSGVINVNDAGIGSAGNITIGATEVIGSDNIDVGGVAVGIPSVDTSSLSSSLSGVAAAGATKSAEQNASDSAGASDKSTTPIADAAVSFLEVEVLGFGEDDEEEKKKREQESK